MSQTHTAPFHISTPYHDLNTPLIPNLLPQHTLYSNRCNSAEKQCPDDGIEVTTGEETATENGIEGIEEVEDGEDAIPHATTTVTQLDGEGVGLGVQGGMDEIGMDIRTGTGLAENEEEIGETTKIVIDQNTDEIDHPTVETTGEEETSVTETGIGTGIANANEVMTGSETANTHGIVRLHLGRRRHPMLTAQVHTPASGTPCPSVGSPSHEGAPEEGEEMEEVTNDDDSAMMAMMGLSGFGTTKGKHVLGNQEGGANVKKVRTWRQYMNRRGGFNRPLDKIK